MLARKALAGTAGAPKIYVEDVFSTYLYTGNGSGNFIENGINLGNANSSGSAYFDGTGDYLSIPSNSVFNLGTGDFTVECWVYRTGTGTGYETMLGFDVTGGLLFELFGGELDYGIRGTSNNKSGTAVPSFQWVHLALSRQSGTVRYFQNGSLINTYTGTYATQDFTNNTAALVSSYSAGAGVFNGYISNLRLVKGTAVYTSAFTPSTSQLTAVSGTSLLLLQGSSPLVDNSGNALSVTAYGDAKAKQFGPFTGSTAGEGGLVWIKERTSVSGAVGHQWTDTARGYEYQLRSDSTAAQTNEFNRLTSFNTNGFTLGNSSFVNANTGSWVSFSFRKAKKFFNVVTFTASSSSDQRIAHQLGSIPGCIMLKGADVSSDWFVYHRSVNPPDARQYVTYLNSTVASQFGFGGDIWGASDPTATDFGFKSGTWLTAGKQYVAYLFAHDAGGFGDAGSDSIIKCGSFTTNGSGGTSEINLGYEPQWMLIKNTSAAEKWYMWDIMRGWSHSSSPFLSPNTSSAETDATPGGEGYGKPTATGFSFDNFALGASNTYIYIAIRRGPMKTPTTGTQIYYPLTRNGTGATATVTGVGFPPDLYIGQQRPASNNCFWSDKLRGSSRGLKSTNTSTETTSGSTTDVMSHDQNGVTLGTGSNANINPGSGNSVINHFFRRAPGFFDIVCYTGTSSGSQTISHNLGAVPELIITRARNSSDDWYTYSATIGNTKTLFLNYTNAESAASSGYWNNTSPTSTQFTAGSNRNGGVNYVAYLFASVSGVSKIGSYTGNGSSVTVTTGFQPRFVMVKRYDSTGDWIYSDSARGLVAGSDPYLLLNSDTAEDSDEDWVDISSTGFTVNQTSSANANVNTGTYIYLAIA